MDEWDRFNDQFRETEYERRERQRRRREELRQSGRCWQCGRLLEDCECLIVPRPTPSASSPSPAELVDEGE